MTLSIRPLHPVFAAEITGLDLRQPPDDAIRRGVEAAMDEYAVSVLPGQFIDDDQQIRFARLFGDLEVSPLRRGYKETPAATDRIHSREIFDVSNLDDEGNKLADDSERRLYGLANRLWHTDSSFRQLSATYSMLSGRVVPPDGADTEFADMRAAWDALPGALKSRLEGLVAVHSIWHSRARLGGYLPSEAEKQARPPARHKLVRVHPGSGRKTLYIASHVERIEGMDDGDAEKLMAELIEFATDRRFVYAHRWRPGDMVIWDNRCTMHRATPFDESRYRRDMRRTTVREQVAAFA